MVKPFSRSARGVAIRCAVAAALLIGPCLALDAEEPRVVRSPREALGALKAGNDRFVKNALSPVSLSHTTRQALTGGQTPFAMVLSCADSRVPPEFIFNVGLGELFVIRSAGEVIDKSILATLEYGAEHLHVPLLVVMGHESCGAVRAAVDNAPTQGPNLAFLVRQIRVGTSRSPKGQSEIKAAIRANVEQVINDALAGSQILRHAVDVGALEVVGAYYELGTGRVAFSAPITPVAAAHRR